MVHIDLGAGCRKAAERQLRADGCEGFSFLRLLGRLLERRIPPKANPEAPLRLESGGLSVGGSHLASSAIKRNSFGINALPIDEVPRSG
ncbi:MAG: hypothetical protein AAF355_06170 [Myxococcota bacterium]